MVKNKYGLDKSDISLLKKHEQHFRRAEKGYMSGIYSTDVIQLSIVYSKAGFHLNNRNCSGCLLAMLRKLGEILDDINTKEIKTITNEE